MIFLKPLNLNVVNQGSEVSKSDLAYIGKVKKPKNVSR